MNNQQMMELTTVEKSEFEQLVSECTLSDWSSDVCSSDLY